MPKVTVLMPVYNAENFLSEAIDSILNQTFTDYEFLIIDDGSTDNSINITNSYQDKRIRLVRNKQNLGISKTLNKGIELAESDIIARMDADDISLPDRLLRQYNYLNDNPDCVLVATGAETISGSGEIIEIFEPNDDFLYYNLTFCCWGIYHPSVMYRRQTIIDVGMYPLTYSEDFKLWCKLIRRYRLNIIPEMLIKYRVTPQSVSNYVFKKENMDEEKKQIISNLRYFCGETYNIPDLWLECYRGNYLPICQDGNIADIVACLKELDLITSHILKKENLNRDVKVIIEAAKDKKDYVIKNLFILLPASKKIALMFRLKMYSELYFYFKNGLLGKLNKKQRKILQLLL